MTDAALSSLQLQSVLTRQMEIIADNLANLSTPGFRSEMMAQFPDAIGQAPKETRFAAPLGIVRDIREGNLTHTGNSLDLAIQGKGFFVVRTPEGERYTRNGRFSLDTEGRIVNSSGYPVLGDDGQPITIPADSGPITIGADGTVSSPTNTLGTIGVASFDKEGAMLRAGSTLFAPGDQLPKPAEQARIIQGTIEESNVKAVMQITKMIDVTRSYAQAQRIVDTEQERLSRAIRIITNTA
jgi:flagellar basal-body rod protein FlgF